MRPKIQAGAALPCHPCLPASRQTINAVQGPSPPSMPVGRGPLDCTCSSGNTVAAVAPRHTTCPAAPLACRSSIFHPARRAPSSRCLPGLPLAVGSMRGGGWNNRPICRPTNGGHPIAGGLVKAIQCRPSDAGVPDCRYHSNRMSSKMLLKHPSHSHLSPAACQPPQHPPLAAPAPRAVAPPRPCLSKCASSIPRMAGPKWLPPCPDRPAP